MIYNEINIRYIKLGYRLWYGMYSDGIYCRYQIFNDKELIFKTNNKNELEKKLIELESEVK